MRGITEVIQYEREMSESCYSLLINYQKVPGFHKFFFCVCDVHGYMTQFILGPIKCFSQVVWNHKLYYYCYYLRLGEEKLQLGIAVRIDQALSSC